MVCDQVLWSLLWRNLLDTVWRCCSNSVTVGCNSDTVTALAGGWTHPCSWMVNKWNWWEGSSHPGKSRALGMIDCGEEKWIRIFVWEAFCVLQWLPTQRLECGCLTWAFQGFVVCAAPSENLLLWRSEKQSWLEIHLPIGDVSSDWCCLWHSTTDSEQSHSTGTVHPSIDDSLAQWDGVALTCNKRISFEIDMCFQWWCPHDASLLCELQKKWPPAGSFCSQIEITDWLFYSESFSNLFLWKFTTVLAWFHSFASWRSPCEPTDQLCHSAGAFAALLKSELTSKKAKQLWICATINVFGQTKIQVTRLFSTFSAI